MLLDFKATDFTVLTQSKWMVTHFFYFAVLAPTIKTIHQFSMCIKIIPSNYREGIDFNNLFQKNFLESFMARCLRGYNGALLFTVRM